jgi:ribosome-associated heat shock protein Hsp15
MAGRDPQTGPGAPAGERQRLDKWLWFARVVKTRALAAKLVTAGHVRLNGVRAAGPDKPVRPGDVLTIALERQVKVLRVVAPGGRRGPYEEARHLYEDLSAAPDSACDADSPDAML